MGGDSHKIIPAATYFKILMILLGLTVLTVLVAPPVTGVNLGVLNAGVAFLIASVKAILVAAIFMHLKYDDRLFPFIIATSVFFVVILYLFSIFDWGTRVVEMPTL